MHTLGHDWEAWRLASRRRGNWFRELLGRREPIELSRTAIASIELENVGRQKRLVVIAAGQSTEVGADLWDPDREWLYRVLENWRNASTVTPPSSLPSAPTDNDDREALDETSV